MTDEHTEFYTLTLSLTGDDARKLADAEYSGTCTSQRKSALISALRDFGAVSEFTRTERFCDVHDLMGV
jgi:hypothetical protein